MKLRRYLIKDWDVLLTLRTNEFTEQAYVGQLQDHDHRMGHVPRPRRPCRSPRARGPDWPQVAPLHS
ncbi:hypothetical protein [Streptomyces sp. NPDC048462]|uniref:hypothetical protein n=1 Tax=Streptomyces sp. NPDC048462 TaxID=3365555 RepID=UPI003720EF08